MAKRALPRNRPAPPSVQAFPRFWNIRNVAGAVPTLELFGDIGMSQSPSYFWGDEPGAGTFQEFAAALRAIGNVPELRVEICSNGGDVVVGKAIHDKLREHPARKTAVIYGICASAATYPAMACDTIQIPANSFFLIHECTSFACGCAEDLRSIADSLDVADASIAALYAARSGKSVEEICAIMEADTWMTGAQAVEIGFADECIDPIETEPKEKAQPANFSAAAINRMPAGAKLWFDNRALRDAQNSTQTPNAMLKPSTPLLNAATDPAAPASGAAPAAAPAPAVLAPAIVAPVLNLAVPAAPAPAAPAQTPQTLDLAAVITNAVNAAVAPLNAQLLDLQNRINHGVTAPQLGGAQPVAAAPASPTGAPPPAPINYAPGNAQALISEGCAAAFKSAGIAK